MSDQRLTPTVLVSTIQGSVECIQQCMCIIDLSKDCEDNSKKMNLLQKQNVENMEVMKNLQKQNVENNEKMNDLQKQNVENNQKLNHLQKQNVENYQKMYHLQKYNVEINQKMNHLQKQNVENNEKMNHLQKQNVENNEKMNDLQNENVKNMESNGKLQDDVKSQLASVDENLKKLTQMHDEYPKSSAESLFPEQAQPEHTHNVSPTEELNGNFPTITIDPEPLLISSSPTLLDTDSPEAHDAIESTRSPLSPHELKEFLDGVKQKRYPHSVAEVALRYTRSIPQLIRQLKEVQRFFDIASIHSRSDRRLESRLPTLIKNLRRYCQREEDEKQGPNKSCNYLPQSKGDQAHPSSSLISSPGISSRENLKRKCEEISTSGTPTKSIGFPSTSSTLTKSTRF